VSSPSDSPPPTAPAEPRPPSTNEIPMSRPAGATSAGQLPPHPDAAAPAAVPVDAPQPTGPVDFVPGLPGLGNPPVPPAHGPTPAPPPPVPPRQVAADPASPTARVTWPDTLDGDVPERGARTRHSGVPRDRSTLFGLLLVVLALALLELGLTRRFGGTSYWSGVPLWSAFATVCTLLGFAAFAAVLPGAGRFAGGWRVAAGGLVGLAVFWLLVVLPVVATDRGFVLTAALAALGGALWVAPRRSS
jgi:hypothetical protein